VLTFRPTSTKTSSLIFEKMNLDELKARVSAAVKGTKRPFSKQDQFTSLMAEQPFKQLLSDKIAALDKKNTIPYFKAKGMQVAKLCLGKSVFEQRSSMIRYIQLLFISSGPVYGDTDMFASAHHNLKLEALFEMYSDRVNCLSYYDLAKRAEKKRVDEVPLSTMEILRWITEAEKSAHSDVLFFD